MVGTRGVPARYGGFETAVEEVGRRLVRKGHDVVVYCRTARGHAAGGDSFLGMNLVHLPAMRRRALETLSHTGLSAAHLVTHRTDVALVFNAANAVWLPVIRAARIPVATHVDGLEWQRAKWNTAGQKYYRAAEGLSVRWSDAIIADARGIQDYYRDEFDVGSELIAYGAPLLDDSRSDRLTELDLRPRAYHLVVSRFEPENHVDVIVDGYSRSDATYPLVVVGSAPYADRYTRTIHSLADSRVRFLGGVWDQELLDQLYANALSYVHGHSVGGTNPSLLRAIGAGAATIAYDVTFNREVIRKAGLYFRDADDVARLVEHAERNPEEMSSRSDAARKAARRYDWDDVADAYERLCLKLKRRELVRVPGKGSRRHATGAASGSETSS